MKAAAQLASDLSELGEVHAARRYRRNDTALERRYWELRRRLPDLFVWFFDARCRIGRRAFAPVMGQRCGACSHPQCRSSATHAVSTETLVTCTGCGVALFEPAPGASVPTPARR